MSNLEETNENNGISWPGQTMGIAKLGDRRDKVLDLALALDNYQIALNNEPTKGAPAFTSAERVVMLQKNRNDIQSHIQLLEQDNTALINAQSLQASTNSTFSSFDSNIDSALNSNNFQLMNEKVTKIVCYISNSGYHKDYISAVTLVTSPDDTEGDHPLGNQFNNTDRKQIYQLSSNDFLVGIDRISSSDASNKTLALVFYTSNNGSQGKVFPVGYKITKQQQSRHKEISMLKNNDTRGLVKADYDGCKRIAESQGLAMLSIENLGDQQKAYQTLSNNNQRYALVGARRMTKAPLYGDPDSMTLNGWKWDNGHSMSSKYWCPNEPNNWRHRTNDPFPKHGESRVEFIRRGDGGCMNDINYYSQRHCLVEKKVDNHKTQSVLAKPEFSIVGIDSLVNLEVREALQYVINTSSKDNLSEMKEYLSTLKDNYANSIIKDEDTISSNRKQIEMLKGLIKDIDSELAILNKLNDSMQDGFGNMNQIGNKFNNFISNIFSNIFSNNKNHIQEGMGNGHRDERWVDGTNELIEITKASLNEEMIATDRIEYEEERNYALELIAQKDNVLSNVLMDYMVNNTKGSNAEKVYEELNQENTDKLRQIKMNDYNTKTYAEYSNILKFVVLLITIMVPFLLMAKYEIINPNISKIIVVVLSFLGFIGVLYRMYRVSRKDNKDFDKDRIPYETNRKVKDRKLKVKLGDVGTGLTCIGEQCCTDGMAYDYDQNRCLTENLDDDLLESLNEYSKISEPFISSNADLVSFKTKILTDSLNNSSADKMFEQ